MNRSLRLLITASFAMILLLVAAVGANAGTPQISANATSLCTLSDAGDVKCAGENSYGILGTGSFVPIPGFQTPLISGVTQLASADTAVCAMKTDGSVWCWGRNDDYQLGQGGTDTTNSAVPLQVKSGAGGYLTGVVQLSAQDGTFCALKSDTTAVCWGRGGNGQLGDGGSTKLSLATQVWTGTQNLSGIRKIASGATFTCAVMIAGGIKCWGSDDQGQLGNGPAGLSALPVDVVGVTNAVDVGAGGFFACARLADATVRCWGDNGRGQIGDGTKPTDAEAPHSILTDVRQIAVGYQTACAQMNDLSLKCWGGGGSGQFLEAAKADKSTPTTIPGVAGFMQMSENFEYTFCVLYRGGAASCWGDDYEGQIGVPPTSGSDILTPTTLPQDLVTLAYPGEGTVVTSPVKTKVDKKKKNYTITAQLTTTPNFLVLPAEACTGATSASVKYKYTTFKTVKKKRKKVKRTKTIKAASTLSLSGANCVSTLSLKLPVKYLNAKKVTVAVTAAGNASLQPISTSASYKLPKVKVKKKKKK
jgi:alpha-tubulin suppressor-like RCC1 family protein